MKTFCLAAVLLPLLFPIVLGLPSPDPTTLAPRPAPHPNPPPYVAPSLWINKPDVTATDTAQDVIDKYEAHFTACHERNDASDEARKKGKLIGSLISMASSAIPKVGGVFKSLTGTVMGVILPAGEDCYNRKIESYVTELVAESLGQDYMHDLHNNLQGYSRLVDHFNDMTDNVPEYARNLLSSMIGDQDSFLTTRYKRFVPLYVRDYLNMRLALYQDMITLDGEANAVAHREDEIEVIDDITTYIREAIHLAGEHEKNNVCSRTYSQDHQAKPGCHYYWREVQEGYKQTKIDEYCLCAGQPHQKLHKSTCNPYTSYYIPGFNGASKHCGSGYEWLSQSQAKNRAYQELTGHLSAGMPWEDWIDLLHLVCGKIGHNLKPEHQVICIKETLQ